MRATRLLSRWARPLGRPAWLVVMICVPLVCGLASAIAQEGGGDAEELEPPKDVTLSTPDRVQLVATYYPGAKGKDTVPIILLHMYNRGRSDYNQLAPYLQSLGHAVLVPDLRGHGDSTQRRKVDRTTGNITTQTLKASTMGKQEFVNMVRFDMPRLKQFLVEKNNAGELNIEKLSIVGAEMGASVAVNFAFADWVRLPEGHKKMGQDVKALVLISPEWSTQGLPLGWALSRRPPQIMAFDPQLKRAFKEPDAINFRLPVALDFRKQVSVFIVVGDGDSRAVREAERLEKMLKPHHPTPAAKGQQDLFSGSLRTRLQGTTLLQGPGLNLDKLIAEFLDRRTVKRSFPWAERTDPYDRG